MRDGDRRDLEALASKLAAGTLSRSDVRALLMIVRPLAGPGTQLRDLADAVAHDHRDRGVAFKLLNAFADNLVHAFLHGGSILAKTLYPERVTKKEMVAVLRDANIEFDEVGVNSGARSFSNRTAEVLDGTSIKLRNPKVERGYFRAGKQPLWTLVAADDIGQFPFVFRGGTSISCEMFFEAEPRGRTFRNAPKG